jgi:hypothetical protein
MSMPHVVLLGINDLEAMFLALKPITNRIDGGILKTSDMYMSRDKTAILIESLAIEGGINRGFLAMVSRRGDGAVVRLYPRNEVEKTPGVKTILALIAKQLLEATPGLKVGETNLTEYLK